MGDYLMSEPALAAIKAAAPWARLTLLGGDFAISALPGRPGPVDEVVLVPPIPGVREAPHAADADPREAVVFYERMRSRNFDLALQLHGGGRNSNPVVLALGAGATAGFQAFDAPPLDCSISYQYWQHEIFRQSEVAAAIGAPAVRMQPQFAVLTEDVAASLVPVPETGDPIVVIHPGATDPRRRWPPEGFAQVADVLTGRGARVLLIGSEEETAPVAALSRHAVPTSVLTFPQLVGLIHRAVLLVGNDSGPRHLADAIGTPTVGVFWCGNMVSAAPVGRANHRVHIAWITHCPLCGFSLVGDPFPQPCCDTVSCVSSVPVEAVLASALELFARVGAAASGREADER